MIRHTILIALLGCVIANDATAQEVSARNRVWAAVGLGAGMPTSGGDGIGNMAQLVYETGPHHIAIRGVVLHDLDRETDTIGEIGVLYGRNGVFGRANPTIGAGVSGVALDTCPDDDDSCFTIGVPLVAEAAVSRRFIGVGVQAFGNINRKASYAGAVLFLQAGWLP